MAPPLRRRKGMNIEKQKTFLIRFAFIALLLGLGYFGIKYALPLMMPFVIGLIISVIMCPIFDLLEEKIRIKRAFIVVIVLFMLYGVIILGGIFFGFKIIAFLEQIFYGLPDLYSKTIEPALTSWGQRMLDRFPEIKPYLENVSNSINDSIFSFLKDASTKVVGMITGFASQIPSTLVKFIFTIVSSIFFSIDYHKIWRFVLRQFKPENREFILGLKDNVIGMIGKLLKAYALLITITFIELSIGFALLGVKPAMLWGFVVALVDIMPILGTGAILIPWAIAALIFRKTTLGAGMLVLYIVITTVRQTLEPKVIGQQIGLHPVVTLLCMFVGVQLMGIWGLFLLPLAATIIKKSNDEGTIHLFK